MAACGVSDPKAVLRQAPNLMHFDHAAAGFLQRRLLLQRCFQLSASQLYEQHPGCLTQIAAERLAQRLQFVEHCGRQLSMTSVVRAKQETFLAAVGASQAEWEAWAAANPLAACPLYRWAQQAAEEEAAQLAAALPPELAQWEPRPNKFKRRSQFEG